VPAGVLKGVELRSISSYSGAFWCLEKARNMNGFLIFLVPFGVLGKVEL